MYNNCTTKHLRSVKREKSGGDLKSPYKNDLEPCVNLLLRAVVESFMRAFLFAGVISRETSRSLSLSNGRLSA